MSKVDGNPDYQYYVEVSDDWVAILDLLDREGVLPGEVLRLLVKGPVIPGMVTDKDYLYERKSPGSYTMGKYH